MIHSSKDRYAPRSPDQLLPEDTDDIADAAYLGTYYQVITESIDDCKTFGICYTLFGYFVSRNVQSASCECKIGNVLATDGYVTSITVAELNKPE